MRINVALIGCVLTVAGCRAYRSANSPSEGAGSAAKPTVAKPAPDKVSASVRKGDEGDEDVSATTLTADIRVEVAGSVHELSLTGEFEYCERREAPVERVVALKDDRLWMVQLFCESGEDFFSREMITGLLLADSAPRVLWQGRGSYSISNGKCEHIDVVYFRPGAQDTVEAVLTSEVTSTGDDPDCKPSLETKKVVATIEIPTDQ